MELGFIGLGRMGGGMAANLQRAGHDLVVLDKREELAKPLLEHGASWAESPAEVVGRAEVVFTSLPGPAEVEEVALGSEGLLSGLRPGSVYFDVSTNSATLVRRVHQAFADRGAHMLDAPVSGGPGGAAAGTLAVWVGGEEEVFRRYEQVLGAIGDKVRYIGGSGAGTVAKLVHNCVGYVILTGMAEVFALGVKAGVPPLDLWGAVRGGAWGQRRTFDSLAANFLRGSYDPASFALGLAHKDVGLATALGRELGVPMRLANMTLEEMTEAMERGWAGLDSRCFMALELERAHVTISEPAERIAEVTSRDGG
jgi:3-hydroxyisobutyrate dehydrogenase-like beta-hydroxyacid dehydrogenase